MTTPESEPQLTLKSFADSFFYGSRSNLDFKFLADLSDTEAADFFEGLLGELSRTINDGDATRIVDHTRSWQRKAYNAHLDSKAAFAYDDVPFSILATPLVEARVALVTSSGHFVAGDDPKPFAIEHMTQTEAEARIGEFLRAEPTLSHIPVDTPADQLRVRHGGYPINAALIDHNVTLPLRAMRELQGDGVIGELAADAYSFVGATSQLKLRERVAPLWADELRAAQVDAVLLVPV
ncbi:MAG: glycine/sarcosine/betaine reductase selenoprotein B family protein [Ilumatobacteraceae bacterium]